MGDKKSKKTKRKELQHQPEVYVSKPMYLKLDKLENRFKRADIEFHGIDHSGASYEGRVFLNNPKADKNTPKASANKYVGSFYIFGHGGCFGDIGHCEVSKEQRTYDYRPSHPLTPAYKRIIVTEQLRELAKNSDKFTVTIVPILAGGTTATYQEIVKLEKISIITYD
jgi:hypothetical protein